MLGCQVALRCLVYFKKMGLLAGRLPARDPFRTNTGGIIYPTSCESLLATAYQLTNVLHSWVEQPVGTGFTQGEADITNERELATEFAGFLQQFLEVFSELKGKNLYASGESYAGMYVPCEHLLRYSCVNKRGLSACGRYCRLSLRQSGAGGSPAEGHLGHRRHLACLPAFRRPPADGHPSIRLCCGKSSEYVNGY